MKAKQCHRRYLSGYMYISVHEDFSLLISLINISKILARSVILRYCLIVIHMGEKILLKHSKRQYTEKPIVFTINKNIPETILERGKSCYKNRGNN